MQGHLGTGIVRVYLDIARTLKGRMLDGELPEGGRLPGELALADSFGVNRLTVRKALDKLAKEGLITTIKGKGSFVAPNQGRAKTVVILSGGPTPLQSTTMQSVACSAMLAFKEGGVSSTVELSQDIDRLLDQRLSGEREISGMLILRTAITDSPKLAKKLGSVDFPIVVEGFSGHPFDFVQMDNKKAIEEIVKRLRSLGHKRIGIARMRLTHGDLRDRHNYALKAIGDMRKEDVCEIRDHVYGPLYDDPDMNAFLSRKSLPSAMLCLSDTIAVNIIRIARKYGMKVPEDLSVIGFDNSSVAMFSEPPLSSVKNDYWALGNAAAKLLMERMSGYSAPRKKVFLPQEFVIRDSCARSSQK